MCSSGGNKFDEAFLVMFDLCRILRMGEDQAGMSNRGDAFGIDIKDQAMRAVGGAEPQPHAHSLSDVNLIVARRIEGVSH